MKLHSLAIAGLLAASLAACGPNFAAPGDAPVETPDAPIGNETPETDPVAQPEAALPAPGRPTADAKAAEIDWTKAREDMAARPVDDTENDFQVASGPAAPPVPVLLPTGIVTTASTGNTPRFQPLSDGYFAAYPGTEYDIIVNGTNEVIGEGRNSTSANTTPRYLATAAGAQISFSRYGADYLVEFECNEISGEDGTCITEADAMAIANELIIAGTR